MITFSSTKIRVTLLGEYDPADPNLIRMFTGNSSAIMFERLDSRVLSLWYIYVTAYIGGVYTEMMQTALVSGTDGTLVVPFRHWLSEWIGKADDHTVHVYVALQSYPPDTMIDTLDFDVDIYPGVSYTELQFPIQKDEVNFPVTRGPYVMPPNVIYSPPRSGCSVVVESNITYDGDAGWKVMGTSTTVTPGGARSNQLAMAYNAGPGLDLHYNTQVKSYPFTALPECTDKVVVRWTSLTGAVRQHVFQVASFRYDAERVRIQGDGDGIRSVRNTVTSLVCRITGLTSYSYWYYMSLLTASDVRAVPVINGISGSVMTIDDALGVPFSDATVEGVSTETPQGNGFHNFEFVLNMRHYDQY